MSKRKAVFPMLTEAIRPEDRIFWIHTSSLGEFEQGLPVIKRLKASYPLHKILVTFFSISRHEIKMNSPEAHYITYLPLDTHHNAKRFLDLVKPEMALFIKSEFWPNYLNEIRKRNIPTYLVSGVFRPSQPFFKTYGGFFRRQLHGFTHFFVQNKASENLLESIGFKNVSVSGDTRFDRVSEFLKRDNALGFIEQFLNGKPGVVYGNSWPEDEAVYLPYINAGNNQAKHIIVPRFTSTKQITALKNNIGQKTVLYSERQNRDLSHYDVLIVDAVGLLSKIYSYAQVAYVGGGMVVNELHNVLEPAVFGIPVVIGKDFKKFNEAAELVARGGVLSINTKNKFKMAMDNLLTNGKKAKTVGTINSNYISENRGATEKVVATIEKHLQDVPSNCVVKP